MYKNQKTSLLFIPVVLSIMLTSCGGRSIILKPSNIANIYPARMKLDSVTILDVEDKRKNKDGILGHIYDVKSNEKIQIVLPVAPARYLTTNLNQLISGESDGANTIPIKIFLDSLTVSEYTDSMSNTAYCYYALRFSYPGKDSATNIIKLENKVIKPRSNGSKEYLEYVFYRAIADCANRFKKNYKKIQFREINSQILADSSLNPTSIFVEDNEIIDSIYKPKPLQTGYSFGITYYNSRKISSGYQFGLHYNLNSLGTPIETSIGFAFTYLNIDNYPYMGSLFSCNFPLTIKVYFSKKLSGLFLQGNFKLTYGTENIKLSYSKESSNSFFGPTFEEKIGLQMSKYFAISVGFYQSVLWGSTVIPVDHGLVFSLILGRGY